MRSYRALLGFVLAPVALAVALTSFDFPLALPVEPYADGVTPLYLDRPYVNVAPDPALAGLRIVRLPRHLRFAVALELTAPARALRLLSDKHDGAAFAGWEPVALRVNVPGRSCVLTRAVARDLAPGLQRLPPGGPVAAAPLLIASDGEIRARTTASWNKLTPPKFAALALAYGGWCWALWRVRSARVQRSSFG